MTSPIKKENYLSWIIWSLGGLFYFYQFVLRASPNVMAEDLMRAFSIEACEFGILAAAYYYAYAVLQIPVGVLLDSLGPKKILRVAILLCSTGALFFSFASTFWLAILGRTLIGAGAASAFLGAIRLATLWFPPHRLALVICITVALGKFGGASANIPLAILVENFNWRTTMLILGIIGFIIAILIWGGIRDKNISEKPRWGDIYVSLTHVMKNPGMWWIAAYGCFMYIPLSAFSDAWGVSFLMKLHNIDKAQASGAITFLFLGTCVGAPLAALFSDYLHKRQLPMMLSAVLSLGSNSALIFMPDITFSTSCFLLFTMGLALSGHSLVFAAACESMPPRMAGAAIGFVNTATMLGGVVLQPLIGFLLDMVWDGFKADGLPLYTLNNYRLALSTIPICMIFSVVSGKYIPETHPRRKSLPVEAVDGL